MTNEPSTERRAWRNAAGTATPPRPNPTVASEALAPLDPLRDLPPSLVHALTTRTSHGAFARSPVSPAMLRTLFDGMRCAASSYNEQPWRFLVATSDRPEAHAKMLACFEPGNQRWAAQAPVLLISCAKRILDHGGKDNPHAWHDLGMAVANLATTATALGLFLHQAAGIDRARVISEYHVPATVDVVAGIALGYHTQDPANPIPVHDARSQRLAVDQVVFADDWGKGL